MSSTAVSERRTPLVQGVTALAILSLVFSLFTAFVSPVIANHDPADGPEVAPIAVGPNDPVWNSNSGGNVPCPAGTTELKFAETPDGTQSDDALLPDGSTASVEITVDGNSFWFIIDNGLAAYVIVKGTNASNVYDYTGAQAGFAGPGIAHDDGLLALSTDSISHISFCLIPLPKGSILIYKDDQTGAPVEGAEFSVTNSEDEEVGTITSDADGFGCLDDLPFGDYTVTETSAPAAWLPDLDPQDVTVDDESTCEDRLEEPAVEDADATFTNTLLGSLLILKTDEGENPLEDAVFTVEGQQGTFKTDADGVFCVDGLVFGETYTVTETVAPEGYDPAGPQDVTVDESADCASREQGPDATFVNTLEEQLGSITVVKVFACDECETRTRGYYFNAADQHEEETNALFGDGIWADGRLFTDVDQVQDYLDADISGDSDGDKGLSARGQLTVQYLTAVLNVLRNGEECDLLSKVYNNEDSELDGWTVEEILAEAELAFDDESDYSDQDIQEALNDINNSSESEENPLGCERGTDGALVDGFTFDLFAEADYPGGDAIDTGTTGDDGTGTLTFSDLELGTYVLLETAPEGMDCTIIDVEGGTLNADGSVTVIVTEEIADVVVTVVNDCEEDQEEADGSLLISKVDDEGAALPGATFWINDEQIADADDGADDGFVCIDGLDLGSEVTVSEAIAPLGFVGDDSEELITISNEDDCAARMAGDPSADWDVQFVNTPEEDQEEADGSLLISKVDDEDEALAGATFWVNDEQIADADDGADDGFVCIDGLDLGSEVTVSEAIAPNGFVLDSSEELITISNEDDCAARMAGDPSADWDVQFVNTPEQEVRVLPTLVIDKAASTEVVHFVFNANGSLQSVTPAQVTWTLTYTLTNGPVSNAVISDPLPAFLTFVSASNGGTFAAGTMTWNLGTLTTSGSVSFVTTVASNAPQTGPIVNVATIDSTETAPDTGQDSIRITSEQVQAGTGTPAPSQPDTAIGYTPAGQLITIPVELMAVLFLLSLGGLTFANVRAARRRR